MRSESSNRSNTSLRSAILNCICPECGGAIELHSNQSDAWDDVANFGELFGKAQRATLRKNSKPIITAHSQKSELSAGRTELAFPS
jgi:hypothetical protein